MYGLGYPPEAYGQLPFEPYHNANNPAVEVEDIFLQNLWINQLEIQYQNICESLTQNVENYGQADLNMEETLGRDLGPNIETAANPTETTPERPLGYENSLDVLEKENVIRFIYDQDHNLLIPEFQPRNGLITDQDSKEVKVSNPINEDAIVNEGKVEVPTSTGDTKTEKSSKKLKKSFKRYAKIANCIAEMISISEKYYDDVLRYDFYSFTLSNNFKDKVEADADAASASVAAEEQTAQEQASEFEVNFEKSKAEIDRVAAETRKYFKTKPVSSSNQSGLSAAISFLRLCEEHKAMNPSKMEESLDTNLGKGSSECEEAGGQTQTATQQQTPDTDTDTVTAQPQIDFIQKELPKMEMASFCDETLFYFFYNWPKKIIQNRAALELNQRKWRFHMILNLWFKITKGERYELNGTFLKGYYRIFNFTTFRCDDCLLDVNLNSFEHRSGIYSANSCANDIGGLLSFLEGVDPAIIERLILMRKN